MLILKVLIAGIRQNRNSRKRAFGFTDFEVVDAAFIGLRYAQNPAFRLDDNFGFDCAHMGLARVISAPIFWPLDPLFGSVYDQQLQVVFAQCWI